MCKRARNLYLRVVSASHRARGTNGANTREMVTVPDNPEDPPKGVPRADGLICLDAVESRVVQMHVFPSYV